MAPTTPRPDKRRPLCDSDAAGRDDAASSTTKTTTDSATGSNASPWKRKHKLAILEDGIEWKEMTYCYLPKPIQQFLDPIIAVANHGAPFLPPRLKSDIDRFVQPFAAAAAAAAASLSKKRNKRLCPPKQPPHPSRSFEPLAQFDHAFLPSRPQPPHQALSHRLSRWPECEEEQEDDEDEDEEEEEEVDIAPGEGYGLTGFTQWLLLIHQGSSSSIQGSSSSIQGSSSSIQVSSSSLASATAHILSFQRHSATGTVNHTNFRPQRDFPITVGIELKRICGATVGAEL
ncbi:hypothetical protein MKZ38_003917 [Zalerion maritima]|uniref:Uncharacterized protein n=1 Tax=Zalerion maritima TaxID=339359 RepID=A0AAD5RN26_9PEZI|nr:hypothetical protein MKZ38_003917 [Zalerion maritima]